MHKYICSSYYLVCTTTLKTAMSISYQASMLIGAIFFTLKFCVILYKHLIKWRYKFLWLEWQYNSNFAEKTMNSCCIDPLPHFNVKKVWSVLAADTWKRKHTILTLNLGERGLCHKYVTLREKCPYSELFWSVFSRIRTEYGEIRSI